MFRSQYLFTYASHFPMTDAFAGRVAERCCCGMYGLKLDLCDSLQQTTNDHAASCNFVMGVSTGTQMGTLAFILKKRKIRRKIMELKKGY